MTVPDPNLRQQAHRVFAQGNFPVAVQTLGRVVAANPGDAESVAMLGMAHSQCGQHAAARQQLESACRIQPRNAGFRYQLGLALERSGDLSGASRAYAEALQLNPGLATARSRADALRTPRVSAPQAPPAARPQPATWASPAAPPAMPAFPVVPPVPSAINAGAQMIPGYSSNLAPLPGSLGDPRVPNLTASEAFWRRFGARMLDSIIVSAVITPLTWILMLIVVAPSAASRDPNDAANLVIAGFIFYVLPVLLVWTYRVGMHMVRSQTVGQMALGLRLVRADGSRPGAGAAVLRDVVGWFVGILTCGVGDLWMLWDPAQQSLADKIGGTYVRRA